MKKDLGPKIRREWAMPHRNTFTIKPIGSLIERYMEEGGVWIDPFCGHHSPAHIKNDLNPEISADYHLDAVDFVEMVDGFQHVLFDPPYSPRQISECYKKIGREVGMKETQSALLYSRVRDAVANKQPVGGLCVSFGWNSVGFGKTRGYEQVEILMVCHGGAHNDTICVVERKVK